MALILLLLTCLYVLWNAYINEREERRRYASNQEVLLSDVRYYKTRDSLNVASVERLQLKVSEYEKNYREQAGLVEDLKIKLKRVRSVATTASQASYRVVTRVRDSVLFREVPIPVKTCYFNNAYVTFRGVLEGDRFVGTIVSRDTLVQVVHRVPRKFLFFRWGTKAIRQEVVAKNPYSKLVYSAYIELRNR